MSPLGSISNLPTSSNVLNVPAASSDPNAGGLGVINSAQNLNAPSALAPTEVLNPSTRLMSPADAGIQLYTSNGVPDKVVYDRNDLTSQLNQNINAYSSPVGMSLEARDSDPDNLVLVIDKKALDQAAVDLVKAQEAQAAKEAEEAEKAEEAESEEDEDEGSSVMSILGHVATVGTIVSLLV